MATTQLFTKLNSLPDYLKNEVNDFVDFLLLKSNKTKKSHKPQFGSTKGFYVMADDFDEPLEDFKEYME